MREIKFRAWDKKAKELVEVYTLSFDNNKLAGVHYANGGGVYLNFEDCVLMQYTGLKDKNGKEIYEGDKFQCDSRDGQQVMQGEIYFDEGCFQMKYGYQSPRNDQRVGYFLSSPIENAGAEKIEIIGNIYEHPNLLN